MPFRDHLFFAFLCGFCLTMLSLQLSPVAKTVVGGLAKIHEVRLQSPVSASSFSLHFSNSIRNSA
jgi:hypothetical protein